MATYEFSKVFLWDNLGGTVRVARNARFQMTDPGTGGVAAGLTQGGLAVTTVATDGNGLASWTATIGTVRPISPTGKVMEDITSPDAYGSGGPTITEVDGGSL